MTEAAKAPEVKPAENSSSSKPESALPQLTKIGNVAISEGGLTILDVFALAVVPAVYARAGNISGLETPELRAKACWAEAEAMAAERGKRK